VLKENIKYKLRVFERKVLRRIYGPTKESNVKKGQNGRKSLRRLKPTVGCNASKRR
jgi:hypothetical protein